MIRIDCPSCSGVSVPCPTCGGLGWLLRPGITDGARGLRLETLREASAAWAGVVRGIVGSTARASRVLDCSAPTLAKMLVGSAVAVGVPVGVPDGVPFPVAVPVEAPAQVRGPGVPVDAPSEIVCCVDEMTDETLALVREARDGGMYGIASVDRGPAGCVPGCVSSPKHRGWHVGPDGRPWRKKK